VAHQSVRRLATLQCCATLHGDLGPQPHGNPEKLPLPKDLARTSVQPTIIRPVSNMAK
jgi:hypothetical protein